MVRHITFGSMAPTTVEVPSLATLTKLPDEPAAESVAAAADDQPPVKARVPPAHPIEDATVQSETYWDRFWRSVSRKAMKLCGMHTFVADWERDIKFRSDVRKEMRTTFQLYNDKTLSESIKMEVEAANATEVNHVPRLVAHATVALRMKLGLGAMDRSVAGNVALVRAEAAKLLRGWNLRDMDAAAHLLEIERCFFEDDTHYRVTTWRARACARSKFVKWCLSKWTGDKTPIYDY